MVFIVINDVITDKSVSYLQIWFTIMIILNVVFLIELVIDLAVVGVAKAYSLYMRV